jgi:hypothetical protein
MFIFVKSDESFWEVFIINKAVNRGDKRTRRDRVFVKFERSRRYRYRCQEKKARRGRARYPVFQDPPR